MAANKDVTVEIQGIKKLLRVLGQLPKDLQNEVRDASTEIATSLVSGAKQNARTPLQAMVAGGLKVKRDRVPVVHVGRGMVRPGVRETDVFYGAEFGGRGRRTTQHFPAHKGTQGYFLYPYARSHGKAHAELWAEAIDKAFKQWDYRAKASD